MITALLPSRGRPEMLARSVASLRDLAARPGEVWIGADNDDPATEAVARSMGVGCLVMPRQGYDRLHVYYQALARVALKAERTDWLLVWNDDAVMTTPRWDALIEALPPRVLVADLPSKHSPYLCCFPAVRRRAVQHLGRFSTDNPHVDTFWQDAGRMAGVIETIPVFVRHDQVPGPHTGNQHAFYEPAHQAELAACAELLASIPEGL